MSEKRGLVLLLVFATVVIFVGLVWAISTYLPLNLAGAPSPTFTVDAPRVAMNCASPVSFWQQHPELYPAQVVISGQVYKAVELNKIFSGQADELPAKLQAQLTAAYLNILSGADQSYIETTIFEAYAWLVQHPAGSQVTDSDQAEGTRLFNLLEAYNLGLTGVKPCEIVGLPLTEAGTATATMTVTVTLAASQTDTPTASETPTLENFPTEPVYTYIAPTKTLKATTQAPTNAPPTAIKTTLPAATNTPVTPTNTPAPTTAPTTIPTLPNTPTSFPTVVPTPTP